MHVQDFKEFVVVPTLQSITKFIPFTEDGMNLVLGTAALAEALRRSQVEGEREVVGIYFNCPVTGQKESVWQI